MNLHIATLLGFIAVAVRLAYADTIYLKNSDRLTGRIERLEDGTLYLNTDYAGTLEISWDKVSGVSSDQVMHVESALGLRSTGRISGSADLLEVRTGIGRTFHLTGITSLAVKDSDDEGSGRWSKLSGSVDVGLSLTRGNSQVNQLSLNLATRYREDSLQIVTETNSVFSKSSDTLGSSRHSGSVRVDRYLTPGYFTFLLGSVEHDQGERLVLRRDSGGGVGWEAVTSRRLHLALLAGTTFFSERFRNDDAPGALQHVGTELLFTANLEKALIGRNLITSKLSVHPDLRRAGHLRVSLETGLRMPVAGPLTLSIRAFERFNNAPYVAVKRHDYGVLSSFGVTF